MILENQEEDHRTDSRLPLRKGGGRAEDDSEIGRRMDTFDGQTLDHNNNICIDWIPRFH
jgi:hypothetical protein